MVEGGLYSSVRPRRQYEARLPKLPAQLAYLLRLAVLRRLEGGVNREEGAVRNLQVCNLSDIEQHQGSEHAATEPQHYLAIRLGFSFDLVLRAPQHPRLTPRPCPGCLRLRWCLVSLGPRYSPPRRGDSTDGASCRQCLRCECGRRGSGRRSSYAQNCLFAAIPRTARVTIVRRTRGRRSGATVGAMARRQGRSSRLQGVVRS